MGDRLFEQIFNLKFAAKQLQRSAVKCEKDEKAERLKVKKAIEKGLTDNAKIYAEVSCVFFWGGVFRRKGLQGFTAVSLPTTATHRQTHMTHLLHTQHHANDTNNIIITTTPTTPSTTIRTRSASAPSTSTT